MNKTSIHTLENVGIDVFQFTDIIAQMQNLLKYAKFYQFMCEGLCFGHVTIKWPAGYQLKIEMSRPIAPEDALALLATAKGVL